jgi:tetratricopeptide (TPR) repeat protein
VRFSHAFVILLLCGITGTVSADKNDKFIVNSRGRFYVEALPYHNKGTELLEKGDMRGARQCFDAAIRIDKNLWPAYLARAEVFAHEGQWKLALEDCNTAAHLRPDFYRTFITRATIYRSMGRCRDGLVDLDKVISFHGNPETDALALSRRALLRATCRDATVRDPKLALADAKQACNLTAWAKASYIGTLGLACAANGDFDAAIRYEQQAIDSGKYSAEELRDAKQRLSQYEHHQSH